MRETKSTRTVGVSAQLREPSPSPPEKPVIRKLSKTTGVNTEQPRLKTTGTNTIAVSDFSEMKIKFPKERFIKFDFHE